jgi:ring-1,2-phenylacetyl-CoA epoxidase subunit PaaC
MPDVRTHEPDDHDNAYAGLLVNDTHWAFGTDFEDPLAGVDTTVPDGVDPATLAAYCLMLGDDALVLSQRLAEWCSNAPDLEEDIALSNIALDLLGQARLLLARAAAADGSQVPALPDGSPVPDEDRLAFFRDAPQFRNVRLVEVPGGDFAQTVVRILLFSSWRLALLDRLTRSRDSTPCGRSGASSSRRTTSSARPRGPASASTRRMSPPTSRRSSTRCWRRAASTGLP